MIEIFILFLLILLNAFIVLSETALISAKKSRLEAIANRGDKKAKAALHLKENPDLFLSTTQIYITLIAILTGVYSGEKFSKYLEPSIAKISFLKHRRQTLKMVARRPEAFLLLRGKMRMVSLQMPRMTTTMACLH